MGATNRVQRVVHGLQWSVVGWLTLIWVLLWGELSLFHVLAGLVVSIVVLTVFPLPPLRFGGKVRPIGLAILVGRFARDLVVASVQVAWLALRPRPVTGNAVVAVQMRSQADLYFMLTAELVSLVPGSLLIETDYERRTMYLHIIGTASEADVERARHRVHQQEDRVMRALANDDELDDYRVRAAGGAS